MKSETLFEKRPLRRVRILLVLLAVLATLGLAGSPTELAASTADLEKKGCVFEKEGLGFGECQHFLRNPAGVTDDPCWCDKCRNGISGEHHDGHTMPKGWNPQLFETGGLDCYLKRHAVAWGINCSACVQNETAPWPDGDGKNLGTEPAKDWAGKPARQTAIQRVSAEERFFKNASDVIVAYNRHFYIVTDVQGAKVKMPSGSSRAMSTHEWAHLMIERAEFARREFTRNLGPLMTETQKSTTGAIPVLPIAMFFTGKERDYERLAAEYFKGPTMKGLKGAGTSCLMCGGMCLSGFGGAKERVGDDHELVAWMRHRIGHNLMALWGSWQVRPKSMPVWMDEGIAQWLTKSIEQYRDDAVFCVGEGSSTQGSSAPTYGEKAWDKDVAKWVATTGKLGPIQELLGKVVLTEFKEEDWKRSWSYCDLCLSEWREPFVKMLVALRQEKDVREAFVANLGCTPEVFDERWRDRVAGRRKSMAPSPEGESEDNETPGSRDRRSIRTETDPKLVAVKVQQLGEVKDVKTIPVVVDVMAKDHDLPRETALVTLLRTKDPQCLQAIWSYGLAHSDNIVRAYTARICGRLKLVDALPKLETQLADPNWFARAEAAVACGTMGDLKALPALRKIIVSDPADKAKVGALDALAMFHEAAGDSAPLVAKLLESSQWQVRVAACQALGEIGQMESVDALVSRMEKETGRVQDEIYETLKKISRDDLGRKPEHWVKWWDALKRNTPNGIPNRPEKPKEEKPKVVDPNSTSDAAPVSFGNELYSSRIGFVCDTSESMLFLFTPDPESARSLSREYVGRDKLTICKQEIAQSLQSLDPRAYFNIVAFGTQIRTFKTNPVPASPGNIESAIGFLQSLVGAGETNYYDSLKAALDLGERPDTNGDFRATPDTITFLTDGQPTKGDLIDSDTLLEWYTGLNRYARVKTHTITFGLLNVDIPLLRGMAERNYGHFTIVKELKKTR